LIKDDVLWTYYPWGTIRPGEKLEPLAVPRVSTNGYWAREMLALTPDERFIVWIDQYHIILLELEKSNKGKGPKE